MLLGIIIGLLIAAVIVLTYLLVKKPKQNITEDETEQEKKLNEHWDKILNYSVAQAYGGE